MKIKNKKYFNYKGKVNDLSVEKTASYNVESLAVHNSVGGSLVAFILGITKVNPIPYKLLFSRFYNAGRKGSLPDIDIDMPDDKRDEMIAYTKNKYGQDKVAQMITFNRLMGRSAIKEVLRVEEAVTFSEMNDITEYIPDESKIADELKEQGETSVIRWSLKNRPKRFARWVTLKDDNSLEGDLAYIFENAIAIEGTPKSQGKHPAGVIISAKPLNKVCPMLLDKNKNPIAGFEMNDLELLGHVKFDFLGLALLTKLSKIINESDDISIEDLDNFNDKATWQMLSQGDTKGIFQIERQQKWTKALKPENIDHLAALTAIIRPGVTESMEDGKNMTLHYVDRKNGREDIPTVHPNLDDIFKDTYGVLVYQETALLLAKEIAGFTLDEADILRKAIGKKKVELMAEVRKDFLDKAEKHGKYSKEIYTKIFDWIEKSQRYAFNAAHSYEYAVNCYYSAYCKRHSLCKFYEVYLNHSDSKPEPMEEVNELINDAKIHHINILAPNLCNFHKDFVKDGEDKIYFGVSKIKGVGAKDCDSFFELAKDHDLCNMNWMEILTSLSGINKRAVTSLISVGVLNSNKNHLSRNRMLFEYNIWKGLTKKEQSFISENLVSDNLLDNVINMINNHKINVRRLKIVLSLKQNLENPPYNLEDSITWMAQKEKEYLGISITCTSVDESSSLSDTTCKDVRLGNVKGKAALAIELEDYREHKIKKEGKNKGKLMAFLSVYDSSAKLNECVIFPDEYDKYKDMFFKNNTLLLDGEVKNKSFIVKRVLQI